MTLGIKVIRLFLQILFAPVGISFMAVTALFEFISNEPDWNFWKEYNEPLLKALPSWKD